MANIYIYRERERCYIYIYIYTHIHMVITHIYIYIYTHIITYVGSCAGAHGMRRRRRFRCEVSLQPSHY